MGKFTDIHMQDHLKKGLHMTGLWKQRSMLIKMPEEKGIGKKLYKALEKILGMQNIINVDACITYPEQEDEYVTKNSAQYHTHLGYHIVGRFYKSGYKFGRWYDMVWMEKYIGKHEQPPKEIIPFSKLREKEIQL